MAKGKFIRIAGKDFSTGDLEKEAKKQAQAQAIERVSITADAIKAELEAIIEDVIANSAAGEFPFYRTESGFKNLKVVSTKIANDRYKIEVLSENGSRENAFNWQDAGSKEIRVKKPVIFPRYEGNIISKGKQSAIGINRADKSFEGSLVRLFPKGTYATVKYARSFVIKAREPKNLYNRAIITLRNRKSRQFEVRGSERNYVFRYVPRSKVDDNLLFDTKLFNVKVVTK